MNIIAVDDERLGLESLISAIRKASPNSNVVGFRDSDEVLEYVKENNVDVAFLDIQMRGTTGIELAKELKRINPSINIIFETGFDTYQQDAFSMHASGYVLKPITKEKVEVELDNLRHPLVENNGVLNRLVIKTFGNFEIFYKQKPIKFKYDKTKELFALLIDRRGALLSHGEIMAELWEDDSHESYLRGLKKDLNDVLKGIGKENVIIQQRGKIAVVTDLVKCDYYDYLNGDVHALNLYRGEYMAQYSWAEVTNGSLIKNW